MQRVRSLLQHYDRYGDEVSEKCIWEEYYYLLRLSLFYPNLKSPFIGCIHLLQFMLYFTALSTHIALVIATVIKSGPEDFLIVINTAHFGFIMLLFLTFIFMANLVRYEVTLFHKTIGDGLFTYEDEEISDEEIKMKQKYESIKRKLKTILPSMNLVAGFAVVVIGPWIDSKVSPGDLRIYTDTGINFRFPIPLWYPFQSHRGLNFYICFLGQCICAYIVIVVLASASCCYFTATVHVIIQLERLIMSVRHLEKRAELRYEKSDSKKKFKKNTLHEDPKFQACLEFCFRQNIQHHQQILRLNKLMNIFTRGPVFATFFAGGVILGMSALILTIGFEKPGIVLGTLTVALTELANITAICKAGQTITDLNRKLHLMTYSTPWYQSSKTMKSCLHIVQEMTCQDLIVKGMINSIANMETYGSILNAAYSYFSLLIAFKST